MTSVASNQNNDRLDRPLTQQEQEDGVDPSTQSKKNYTAQRWGNDKGSIIFGGIDKDAAVTAGVQLQAPDGRHQLSLDIDGNRKGWTCSTSPGNFQVECGSDNVEAQDSLILEAKNGNIIIKASNGKIRLQGTDIELVAVGEGGSKGNIKLEATENVATNCKKFLVTAKMFYKIATPGIGQLCANSVLQMYGSIIRGVTDACSVKESKVGGKKFQQEQNVT